jgi:hypothetical protein
MIGKHPLMADCSLMARDRGIARIVRQKPRMSMITLGGTFKARESYEKTRR